MDWYKIIILSVEADQTRPTITSYQLMELLQAKFSYLKMIDLVKTTPLSKKKI